MQKLYFCLCILFLFFIHTITYAATSRVGQKSNHVDVVPVKWGLLAGIYSAPYWKIPEPLQDIDYKSFQSYTAA